MDDVTIRAALRDELSRPLADVRRELGRLAAQTDEVDRSARRAASGTGIFGSGIERLNRTSGSLVRGLGSLSRVGFGLSRMLAGGITVGLGLAAATGVKTAAAMQNAEVSFTTMLGSGKKAQTFLSGLRQFAKTTPFEFPELQTAASSLISVGIQSDKVIPIMRTLGDVTAGMGTGSEGIQRATVAIQQMTAAGRIQAEDLNQLRDAGVPVYDLLASALGKTKAEVVDLVQKGKLGGDALEKVMGALETGKGLERFTGLMDKQSKTLGGAWSNLTDTVQMGLADALKPAVPLLVSTTNEIADLATQAGPKLSSWLKRGVHLVEMLVNAFRTGGLNAVVSVLGQTFGVDLHGGLDATRSVLERVWTIVQAMLPDVDGMNSGFGGALDTLGLLNPVLSLGADHAWAVGKATQAIAVAMAAAKVGTYLYGAAQLAVNGYTAAGTALKWAENAAFAASNTTAAVWVGVKLLEAGAYLRNLPLLIATNAQVWASNAAYAVSNSTLVTWLGVKALELGAWLRTLPATIAQTAAMVANRAVYGISYLATWLGVKAIELAAWARSAAVTAVATAAMIASRAVTVAGAIATGVMTAAQWALNAAMTANPIGIVIALIVALVAGIVIAYKHSATFRGIIDGLWGAIKTAGQWVWDTGKKVGEFALKFSPLGLAIGFIVDHFDDLKRAADFALEPIRKAIELGGKVPGVIGKLNPFGDTSTPRGAGSGGNMAATTAAVAPHVGAGVRMTSGLRTFGLGSYNSDHRHGRAIDLVGSGLGKVAAGVRRDGGYAAYHGTGQGRHLHVVPATGGGGAPRARLASARGSDGPAYGDTPQRRTTGRGRPSVQYVVAAGAVSLSFTGTPDAATLALIDQRVRQGLAAAALDAQERS